MEVQVNRGELVQGVEYYFSDVKRARGIFVGRENNMIYFTPTVKGMYSTVGESYSQDHPDYSEQWKDMVYFTDDNDLGGFEQVETDKMGQVKNGSKVRVVDNLGGSNNEIGDEGIVRDYCGDTGSEGGFRVSVQDRRQTGNWHSIEEVEVIHY